IARQTPVYSASARIYVERNGPRIINEQPGLAPQSTNYLATQCELIKSSAILGLLTEREDIRQMRTFAGVANGLGLLKGGVSAAVGLKDDVITISFESVYAEEAAEIANGIVEAYITHQSRQKRSTAAEVLKILQKEKEKREGQLREGYERLL